MRQRCEHFERWQEGDILSKAAFWLVNGRHATRTRSSRSRNQTRSPGRYGSCAEGFGIVGVDSLYDGIDRCWRIDGRTSTWRPESTRSIRVPKAPTACRAAMPSSRTIPSVRGRHVLGATLQVQDGSQNGTDRINRRLLQVAWTAFIIGGVLSNDCELRRSSAYESGATLGACKSLRSRTVT